MPNFILIISYYLFNSLDLGCAFSNPSTKSPFELLKKTNDRILFSASLIHYSSPKSPFFNPNYTRNEHIKDGVLTSLARGRYFSQIKNARNGYMAAPVYGGTMLMEYTIGTPPFQVYGVFDTGSSFTWVQCLPCIHCINQKFHPIFDPKNSSSYKKFHCFDRECLMAPRWSCGSSLTDDPDLCLYNARYMDDSTSRGILSTETLTFSAEDTSKTVENIVFGCGNDNRDRTRISPGIVGVGNLSASLVHQLLVSHFSYYVYANSSHIGGVVHFGPGSSITEFGMTTPLLPNDRGFYYLNLTGISVDGSDLDLPHGIFENGVDEDGKLKGFLIDTGCSYTLLHSEAFDVLKSAITDAMYDKGQPAKAGHFEVCYTNVSGAPEVVFQFNGLDYILCEANLWIRHYKLYCLAMIRLGARDGKVSVLGFHQQRNLQVGFDLERNLLSLVYPGACPDDAVDFVQL